MRTICGILSVILLLFAAVQYNDPDFMFWGAAYGIGAMWTGFAAFSPGTLRWGGARAMLAVCLAAALWGVLHFWPESEHWWWTEVWWVTETAREGMGMMFVLVSLLAAGWVALSRRVA